MCVRERETETRLGEYGVDRGLSTESGDQLAHDVLCLRVWRFWDSAWG